LGEKQCGTDRNVLGKENKEIRFPQQGTDRELHWNWVQALSKAHSPWEKRAYSGTFAVGNQERHRSPNQEKEKIFVPPREGRGSNWLWGRGSNMKKKNGSGPIWFSKVRSLS